jgi:hypothetical protein
MLVMPIISGLSGYISFMRGAQNIVPACSINLKGMLLLQGTWNFKRKAILNEDRRFFFSLNNPIRVRK